MFVIPSFLLLTLPFRFSLNEGRMSYDLATTWLEFKTLQHPWQHEKLHHTIEPFHVVALFSLRLMPLGVV
jgi:hypothetical protein